MRPQDSEEAIWQRLAKVIFGRMRTTDEGLFVYRVMEQIRHGTERLEELLAWRRFLRWTIPVFGIVIAGLIFAARTPSPWLGSALFQQQTADEDPLGPLLEALP